MNTTSSTYLSWRSLENIQKIKEELEGTFNTKIEALRMKIINELLPESQGNIPLFPNYMCMYCNFGEIKELNREIVEGEYEDQYRPISVIPVEDLANILPIRERREHYFTVIEEIKRELMTEVRSYLQRLHSGKKPENYLPLGPGEVAIYMGKWTEFRGATEGGAHIGNICYPSTTESLVVPYRFIGVDKFLKFIERYIR